ncbi:MAG: EAL domain-containing protein [Caldilinea sp. CFX5]|nr:EAL domain-containing protein [Caldilinea sp. CFX5]
MQSRILSIWSLWLVPFVVLIFLAVGMVGFLSLRNGEKAVNALAEQLLERTNQLVTQHLESYLAMPKCLAKLDALALENGTLDWQDFTAISNYFWQQARLYEISWINYGLADTRYAGAGYLPDDPNGQMIIGERSLATGMAYYDFFTDEQGQRISKEADPTYDFREEAWFVQAMATRKPGWSEIYLWEGTYSTMSVGLGYPIFLGHAEPIGAIGMDLSLANISNFLQNLEVAPSARIFIIEQDGMVVATSTAEPPFVWVNDHIERVNITNSTDPLIRATATYLLQQVKRFDQIHSSTAFQFFWSDEEQYVRVTPWHDELGLDWLVVVVVSESDFMAQMNANTRQTILLSVGALLITLIIGFFTSRLITQRVAALEVAAHQIAAGQLTEPVAPSGIRELDAVGHSFNSMATQLRDSFARLEFSATHDALTGLPNRAAFQRLLTETIERYRLPTHAATIEPAPTHFAVLFLDLDYFKLLNDSLGHLAGDQVLVEIAGRLQSCVQDHGQVARFGGDEFVILLDPITEPSEIEPIVQQILSTVRQPLTLEENTAFVSTSIGIVFSSHYATDADGILRNADTALYRAKANGKAVYEVFDDEMHREVRERLQLETDLRHALEQQQLAVYYQPIVDANTLTLVGVEALTRWRHPKLGMVPPSKFIPIAEETGLILPLGWWVLRTACQQMQQWRQQFADQNLVISVNLSTRQFLHPELLTQVQQILQETGLPPQALKLELTESLLISDRATMIARLLQLKALGVELSLDDFGTGYSSLSYLHHFPLDTLKIDRSFIQQILTDRQCRAVVESIVTMAHKLGMDVIAEGVETEDALSYLRDTACCEQIQGFLISAAVPPTEISQRLAKQTKATLSPIAEVHRTVKHSFFGDSRLTR